MKIQRTILVFLTVVFATMFFSNILFASPVWYQNIGLVKTNMNETEVRRILGAPHKIRGNTWYYQQDGPSVERKVGGYVAEGVIVQTVPKLLVKIAPYKAGPILGFFSSLIANAGPSASSALHGDNERYLVNVIFDDDRLVSNVKYSGSGTKNTTKYTRSGTAKNTNNFMYPGKEDSVELAEVKKNAKVYKKIQNSSVTDRPKGGAPYYSINGLVHKPDCKTIMEIEKNKMDRTATLSEALEKGSEACPECCGDEPIVKLVNRHHVTSIDVANEAVDSHDVYVVDGIIHFDKRCPHLIDTEYVTILESNLKGDKIPHFCETKDIW
ncbi:hypothetical protein HOE22_09210 [Candidatus Woesearchaeota archaeon]|jgi:hypothetical protein|nr:hypothetical protein [bacterium]MBT4208506.1 hypothetical protein [Candidatus Woesearchaeota archaeon]